MFLLDYHVVTLARLTGRDAEEWRDVIRGTRSLDAEMAAQLEEHLGVPTYVWKELAR